MNPWTDPMVATHTPMTMVVASLLLSFVLGQLIAWLYSITHRGMTWSRNMVHSIVMLSMIVTGVMLVMGKRNRKALWAGTLISALPLVTVYCAPTSILAGVLGIITAVQRPEAQE